MSASMLCLGLPFLFFLKWYSDRDQVGKKQRAQRRRELGAFLVSKLVPEAPIPVPRARKAPSEVTQFVTRCSREPKCRCALCAYR